ncbi:MAG TPA: FAD-binding oxidoreductase [Candidatus Binatia bacterium]|nr:FAD-binding oxidoreductase [Candidatus Binatia bacterium]
MTDPAFARLRSSLHGTLLLPEDDGYEEGRAVWNAAIDRRPAAIVRCADPSDVTRALELARARELPIAVRGGGHSFAGKSTCDGGIVIDCGPMKEVTVDPGRRVLRAGGGCTLRDVDGATQALGLATTLGTVGATGIAGLTLGGGLGWLMGRFGLACDNLIAAEVVTADGRTVRTSATERPDLLWGLRGGGGNFGIVTAFEYRLHPVTTVLGGAIVYPVAEARDVLRLYRDVTAGAPDDLTAYVGIQPLAASGPTFSIAACWSGDLAEGERVLAPLRRGATVLADGIRPISYSDMQALLDVPPVRVGSYARSSFLRALSDDAIDVLARRTATAGPLCAWFIEHVHGRVSAIGPDEAAFRHRGPCYSFAALSLWMDPAETEAAKIWVGDFFTDVGPFLASGVYSNYLADDEGAARVRAAYGPAWDRLVALKRTYDPDNVFRLNQNVLPSA